MKRLRVLGLVLGFMILGLAAQATPLGYTLNITTTYNFGCPAGSLGPYCGAPDTGWFTVTNAGSTTFTGTIGQTAVSQFSGDFSFSIPGLTLAPGQSAIFTTSPESSNEGGFNSPFGSPQLGIQIYINGLINGTEAVNLSVYDSQIHSGTSRVSPCDGVSTDAYVLQGSSSVGCDNGDDFEVAAAEGHYQFLEAAPVPEPATLAMMGVGLFGLGTQLRRRMKK